MAARKCRSNSVSMMPWLRSPGSCESPPVAMIPMRFFERAATCPMILPKASARAALGGHVLHGFVLAVDQLDDAQRAIAAVGAEGQARAGVEASAIRARAKLSDSASMKSDNSRPIISSAE